LGLCGWATSSSDLVLFQLVVARKCDKY